MLLAHLTEVLQFGGAVDHLCGGDLVGVEQGGGGALEQPGVRLTEADQLVLELVELGSENSTHDTTVVARSGLRLSVLPVFTAPPSGKGEPARE